MLLPIVSPPKGFLSDTEVHSFKENLQHLSLYKDVVLYPLPEQLLTKMEQLKSVIFGNKIILGPMTLDDL